MVGVATALAAGLHWCSAGHFLLMDGCYNIGAAPGGGACREARDGACVGYAEEHTVNDGRYKASIRVVAASQCTQQANINNCAENMCEMVGTTEVCTECKQGKVPIDGQCQEASTVTDKCKNIAGSAQGDQVCGQCLLTTFMYKGGCYATANAPGKTMCTQAANGICSAAAAGYFVPPEADRDATKQSVIPCGDDSVVTVKDDKQYKGVANCLTYTPPGSGTAGTPTAATCDKCADGYFGNTCTACHQSCLTCSTAGVSGCKSCKDGYFLGATSGQTGKCVSCGGASDETWKGVDGCLKCTTSGAANTPATCTECQADRYFKEGPPVSCVTAETCNTGYFPNDNADGKKMCLPCSDNNNGGIENCGECSLLPSASRSSTVLITCTKCGSDKYLKADGSGCVESSGCASDSTEFAKEDSETGNRCVPCGDKIDGIADCKTCSKTDTTVTCSACTTEGKKPTTAGTACVACSITDCANCNEENVCVACGSSKYLTPTGQCISDCAALSGYYDDNNSKTCKKCDSTCLTCSGAGADKCKSCTAETHFLGAADGSQGKCVSCGDAAGSDGWKGVEGCAKCTKPKTAGAATCTECAGDLYLKTVGSTTSCETNCGEGFFATTVENVKKCVACSAVANGGIANCKTCSLLAQGSRAASLVSCLTCEQDKHLTPTKEACLDACPAGSYTSGSACVPCDPSCAECSAAGAERCTACPAGRMLRYADEAKLDEGGQCVAECMVGADGCTECGLAIGGTKYCSRCSEPSQAPLNGVCVSNAARAQFCTTASGGACSACATGYFIQQGGCYQTTRLPGKSVCTTESGGKCTTCASGQTPESSTGVCPLCHETCAKCSATNSETACTECLAGYYKTSANTCVKCSENSADGTITSIPNCVSCAPPITPPGPVTCYVTQDPTVDPADLSRVYLHRELRRQFTLATSP